MSHLRCKTEIHAESTFWTFSFIHSYPDSATPLKTEGHILLVTIYSKSDKADVPAAEIRELIKRAESETPEDLEELQWFKNFSRLDRHA